MSKLRIGFIGAGQMARALAGGWVGAGAVAAIDVVAADPAPGATAAFIEAVPGARSVADNAAVVRESDVVVLAVKPQHIATAVAGLSIGRDGPLVLSIAAGIRLASLAELLPAARLVRVMPNTPCLVRQSASGYALGPGTSAADGQLVARLLAAVGRAVPLDEKLLDAVTGLSGSGPAFVFVIIDALADGGVRMGLPREAALLLAAQTVRGAAEMVLTTGEHPAVLKDRVASPGGTTIAGLSALEAGALRGTLIAAVEAATRRSTELGNS